MTTLTFRQAASVIGSLSGKDRTIAIPLTYIDLTDGDHTAALFLSQVLYWTQYTKNEDGWFYKTTEEWYKELRLTYRQISRVSKLLKPIGLETKLKKHDGTPKTFYRINFDIFIPIAVTFVNTGFSPFVKIAKCEIDKMSKSTLTKGENLDFDKMSKSSISYSQEDTQEELTQEAEPPNPVPLTSPTQESEIFKPCNQTPQPFQSPTPPLKVQSKPPLLEVKSFGSDLKIPGRENDSHYQSQSIQDFDDRFKRGKQPPPGKKGFGPNDWDEGFVEWLRQEKSKTPYYAQTLKREAERGDVTKVLSRDSRTPEGRESIAASWQTYKAIEAKKAQVPAQVVFVEPVLKPTIATTRKLPKLSSHQTKELMRLIAQGIGRSEAYEQILQAQPLQAS